MTDEAPKKRRKHRRGRRRKKSLATPVTTPKPDAALSLRKRLSALRKPPHA